MFSTSPKNEYSLQEILEIGQRANQAVRQTILKGSTQIENNKLPLEYFNYLLQGISMQVGTDLLQQNNQYDNRMIGVRDASQQIKQEKIASGQSPLLADYEADIAASKKYSFGNCYEMALLAFEEILNNEPDIDAQVVAVENGDHVVVLLNTGKKNAVIIDPWSNSVFPFSEINEKLKTYKREKGFYIDFMPGKVFDKIDFSTTSIRQPILIQYTNQEGKEDYKFFGLHENEWKLTDIILTEEESAEFKNFQHFEQGIFLNDNYRSFTKLKNCHPQGKIIGKNCTYPFDKSKHSLISCELSYRTDIILINTNNIRRLKEQDKSRVIKISEYLKELMNTYSDESVKLIRTLIQYNHDLEIEKNRLIKKHGNYHEKISIIQNKQNHIHAAIDEVNTMINSLHAENILDIATDTPSLKFYFSQLLSSMYDRAIFTMRFSEADRKKLFKPTEYKAVNNLFGVKSKSLKNLKNVNKEINQSIKTPLFEGIILVSQDEYDYLFKILLPALSRLIKELNDENDDNDFDYGYGVKSAFLEALNSLLTEINKMNIEKDAHNYLSTNDSLLKMCIKKIYQKTMKLYYPFGQEPFLKFPNLQYVIKFYLGLYTSLPAEQNIFINELLASIYPDIANKIAGFIAENKNSPLQFDIESFKVFCDQQNEREIDGLLELCTFSATPEQFGSKILSQEYTYLYSRLINAGFIYHPDFFQMDDECLKNIKKIVEEKKNNLSNQFRSVNISRFTVPTRPNSLFHQMLPGKQEQAQTYGSMFINKK